MSQIAIRKIIKVRVRANQARADAESGQKHRSGRAMVSSFAGSNGPGVCLNTGMAEGETVAEPPRWKRCLFSTAQQELRPPENSFSRNDP